MTYGEARDKALQLINQYSLGGGKIAETYNNQADYIRRIPGLINDAQIYIATSVRRISHSLRLDPDTAEQRAGMLLYTLPGDLMDISPAGLLVIEEGRTRHETGYIRTSEEEILVPAGIKGEIYLEYFRTPHLLPLPKFSSGAWTMPSDSMSLDNTPQAQNAIPYFVGAHLALQDDAYVYQSLNNAWLSMLKQLTEIQRPERHTVEDAYGTGAWGDYC